MDNIEENTGGLIKIELQEIDELEEESLPSTSTPRTRNTLSSCLKREVKRPGKRPFYYVQKFRREWLDDAEFQPWLKEVEDDVSKCRCIWCRRDLHARLHELKRHMNTKKHQLIADQYNNATKYYGTPKRTREKVKEETASSHKAHIINILKDISVINEDLNDTEVEQNEICEEKENEGGCKLFATTQLLKEQSERNDLMNAFVNVQKERLHLNRQQLDAAKTRLVIHQELLNVLSNELSAKFV